MNIFYTDPSPKLSAQNLVDKHCVKMIVETAQLLSTAHRVLDGKPIIVPNENGRKMKRWILDDSRDSILMKATHINHPSAIWCRQTSGNYDWLYRHFCCILEEYKYRYCKNHKCEQLVKPLFCLPNNIVLDNFTEPTPAMDKKYIISKSSVENYRNYYKNGKQHLFNWKNRKPPDWINIC